MLESLSNNSLFAGQLYEDKSRALRARDLIFFTTDLQTVNNYSTIHYCNKASITLLDSSVLHYLMSLYYNDVHNNVANYCNKNIFTFSCKNAISKYIYFLCHVINRTLNSSFYIIEFIFVAK